MTASLTVIFSNDGAISPKRSLDRTTAEALALYIDRTFPMQGRRKLVAKEWDLRDDEARAAIDGQASKATLDRIFKHKNGGWRVILPVMGEVTGQTADAFIIAEKERVANERRSFEEREARLGQMARDLRSMVGLAFSSAG